MNIKDRNAAINREYKAGGVTFNQLGAKYGITANTARNATLKDDRRIKDEANPPQFYGLSVRASNVIKNAGYMTEDEARSFLTYQSLMREVNCSKVTAREICDFLGLGAERATPKTHCPCCGHSLTNL